MRLATFSLLLLLLLGSTAQAQVIDVFDNQDKMPTTQIEVKGTGGESIDFEGTGGAMQADGGITIKFERKDSSIMIPAKIRGKSVYFLFDTGATYTTLSGRFAKSVNLLPKKHYPVARMQTANGVRPAQFGMIDRLTLGGRSHGGVTFSLCDSCPSGSYKGKPVVGLLGLNVVGRYRYSINEASGKIEMYPHSAHSNQIRDARPWLRIQNKAVKTDLSKHKFKIQVENVAPRTIKELKVAIQCSNGKEFILTKRSVGKKTTLSSRELKRGECTGARVDVQSVRW